eukprot:GHVS01033873.1.p1 GENE.GHVS01033873.1~~GHVS01033873.1.p1  ORF type:complete len:363 (-),score=22.67 GHVS01033873.1:128-1216(-)
MAVWQTGQPTRRLIEELSETERRMQREFVFKAIESFEWENALRKTSAGLKPVATQTADGKGASFGSCRPPGPLEFYDYGLKRQQRKGRKAHFNPTPTQSSATRLDSYRSHVDNNQKYEKRDKVVSIRQTSSEKRSTTSSSPHPRYFVDGRTLLDPVFMQAQPTRITASTELRPHRYCPILEGCYYLYLEHLKEGRRSPWVSPSVASTKQHDLATYYKVTRAIADHVIEESCFPSSTYDVSEPVEQRYLRELLKTSATSRSAASTTQCHTRSSSGGAQEWWRSSERPRTQPSCVSRNTNYSDTCDRLTPLPLRRQQLSQLRRVTQVYGDVLCCPTMHEVCKDISKFEKIQRSTIQSNESHTRH